MARDPYGAILFPFGYVMGGILGGMLGVDEDELKSATLSIGTAVRQLEIDERIAQMVINHLTAINPGQIRIVADNIPMEPAVAPGRMRRGDGGRLTWLKPPPAPHPLDGTGLEIVIGWRVTYLGFQARSDPRVRATGDMQKLNPPLALVLSVDVTAVRVRDWSDLGGLTARYESTPRKFTEWAAAGAQPLRREIEAALQEIHRQLIRQVTREPKSNT